MVFYSFIGALLKCSSIFCDLSRKGYNNSIALQICGSSFFFTKPKQWIKIVLKLKCSQTVYMRMNWVVNLWKYTPPPPPYIHWKLQTVWERVKLLWLSLCFEGFSDPYVLVQFCPEHVFHDVPVQQTSIQKKTLNPVFDESFELWVYFSSRYLFFLSTMGLSLLSYNGDNSQNLTFTEYVWYVRSVVKKFMTPPSRGQKFWVKNCENWCSFHLSSSLLGGISFDNDDKKKFAFNSLNDNCSIILHASI